MPTAMTPFHPRPWLLPVFCVLVASGVQAQGLKPSPRLQGATAQMAMERASAPVSSDYIVAVVNSEPITNHEVRSRLARAQEQLQRSGTPVPSESELAKEVLELLILEKAQLQIAAESGIRIEASALDEAEANIARQNQLSVAQMHERLTAQGLGVAAFRDNLRRQLTLQRLREREVEARVRVSEVELDRFVAQKLDNPGADLQLNLAQVLVAVPEQADEARIDTLRQRAQEVAAKARAGEEFADLVRAYSDAPDRATGGVFGLRPAQRYPDLFVSATRAVAVGGVAGPVRSPAGFHVLKVLDKRVAGMPDDFAIQTRARHILLRPTAQLGEQAALARVAEWRRQVATGKADFADLAKAHSQDSSAEQGGDLGWVPSGVFVPEFEEVMNSLPPGQLSEPVVSRFGVHLIQVQERRRVELTERERREQIRQLVKEQKLDEAYLQWQQDIRARAYVEYREAPQ